jgi:ankyrin repeat protein
MIAAWKKAITGGNAAAVGELLRGGADVDARDKFGQTGLMLAARAGHREIVEVLVQHGADLDVAAKFNLTALMLAVIAGHAAIARLLASAGADLGHRGSGAPGFADKTARDLAVAQGMLDLAAELDPER